MRDSSLLLPWLSFVFKDREELFYYEFKTCVCGSASHGFTAEKTAYLTMCAAWQLLAFKTSVINPPLNNSTLYLRHSRQAYLGPMLSEKDYFYIFISVPSLTGDCKIPNLATSGRRRVQTLLALNRSGLAVRPLMLMLLLLHVNGSNTTTKLRLNTPQCTQSKQNVTTVC